MSKKILIANDATLSEQGHPSTEKILEVMHPFKTATRILVGGISREWSKHTEGLSEWSKFYVLASFSVFVGLLVGKLIAG